MTQITSDLLDEMINELQDIQRNYYNHSHILQSMATTELFELITKWNKYLITNSASIQEGI